MRDFQALIDHSDAHVQRLERYPMRPTRELFRHGARYRDGALTREPFQSEMRPGRQTIESLVLRGEVSGSPKLTGMCEPSYDHRDWLWTFLDVEGVEPTNNVSERALRPAII